MPAIPQIKPKEITVKSIDGEDKQFRISRVPATQGREIFTQYMPTAMPKIGNYKSNEDLMKKLMLYVDVKTTDGSWVRLENEVILDSHITDWEMLVKIELEMVKYNTNFFNPEKLSSGLSKLNQTLPERITLMLKRLLVPSSAKSKPR
jgi:hypothetical protein